MLQCKKIDIPFSIDGVYTAFRFDWNESFVFTGESHNFWEMVFVADGEVEVTEDENVYKLRSGNAILHAPMEFHRIKSSGGTSPTGFIISFTASGRIPDEITRGVLDLNERQIEDYGHIFELASEFVNNGAAYACGMQFSHLLSAFFINLCQSLGSEPSHKYNSSYLTESAIEYRKIVSFMFYHIRENLSLTDIALQNRVSVSYLKLLFNTYAGISPKKYFNNLRLRHADDLLSQGLPITAISDTMNFSSPNYFSYFYKNNTGRSPSEHRKRI